MDTKLSGPQQETYHSIFHHPMSHSVEWSRLRSMFQALGQVVEEKNGNVKITRNGHSMVLHPGSANDITDISSLVEIRHFLRTSNVAGKSQAGLGQHLLVVIDHQEARIFKSILRGSTPEKIVPHDPHGFGRHVHNVHDHAKGQHHPVPKSFFEAVSKTLQGANQILIFGSGKGGGSAMNELLSDLDENHQDLAHHVVGAKTVDEQHLTEDQLLAMARDFYDSKWASKI